MQQTQTLMKIEIEEDFDDIRVDKVLAAYLSELSRTYIQKLIENGNVTLAGKTLKANFKVTSGQELEVLLPEPETLKVEPENIPMDILYEDSDVIVVNKPKNMVVHPAAGHYSGTLVNALLYHCKDSLSGINGIMRPGIVHRIDKDTTGALVVCKNDASHQFVAAQLKEHSITRKYEAIVYQTFKETEGRVEGPIGRHPSERTKMAINYKNGKDAITNYRVLENLGNQYAHIECRLETGRTHQIRVHMTSLHHPLLGDTVYGPAKDPFGLEGQTLHARILGFVHPTTKEYMEFEAPLPEYFTKLLQKLRK